MPTPPPRRCRVLGVAASGGTLALTVMVGAAPIPLSIVWATRFGLTPALVAIAFISYVVGVGVALVTMGSASDRIGRRPMLLLALALAGTACALFITASGLGAVLTGRFVSGVAAGVATSTASAFLGDLLGPGATAERVTTAASVGGIGVGVLLAGAAMTVRPDPTGLVFVICLVLAALAALLSSAFETVHRTSLRLVSLRRPQIPGERAGRAEFVSAALAVAAAFGLNGFFSSLAPAFLRHRIGVTDPLADSAVIALLFVAATAAQLVAPGRWLRALPLFGLLAVGAAALLLGLATAQLGLFLAATVVAGAAVGLTFRRGIGVVARIADPSHRADLSATYFLAAYAGLVIPTLALGLLTRPLGAAGATGVLVLIVLALGAIGLAVRGVSHRSDPEGDPTA